MSRAHVTNKEGHVACVEHLVHTEVNITDKDGMVCPANVYLPSVLFMNVAIHCHLLITQEMRCMILLLR